MVMKMSMINYVPGSMCAAIGCCCTATKRINRKNWCIAHAPIHCDNCLTTSIQIRRKIDFKIITCRRCGYVSAKSRHVPRRFIL